VVTLLRCNNFWDHVLVASTFMHRNLIHNTRSFFTSCFVLHIVVINYTSATPVNFWQQYIKRIWSTPWTSYSIKEHSGTSLIPTCGILNIFWFYVIQIFCRDMQYLEVQTLKSGSIWKKLYLSLAGTMRMSQKLSVSCKSIWLFTYTLYHICILMTTAMLH
jgi:hypothetical protein